MNTATTRVEIRLHEPSCETVRPWNVDYGVCDCDYQTTVKSTNGRTYHLHLDGDPHE